MSVVMSINPFDYFFDLAGAPLDEGYIYIGEPNKDPRAFPVQAFYDEALTIPAAMPLRTIGGYVSRNNAPAYLYIGGNYSVLVLDKKLRQVFYVRDFLLIGNGAAASIGDLTNETDPNKGAAILGRSVVAISSVFDLQKAKQNASQQLLVKSYHPGRSVGGGVFFWSPTTPKSQHNGWRVIDPGVIWDGTLSTQPAYLTAVGGPGVGCFVRVFDGTASPEMAGAISDWNGTTGTEAGPAFIALVKDVLVSKIFSSGKVYWFGKFTAGRLLIVIKRDIRISLPFCDLIAEGEASVNDFSASLFFHEDCRVDIDYGTFDDMSYTFFIAGRGIQPVTLVTRTKSVYGHTIGPCHIKRGQSIITCAPLGDSSFRASGIKLRGAVTSDVIYYGINLANNGDNFEGSYVLGEVLRSIYVFGVDGVNANIYARKTIPASASILIAQSTGSRPTKNIDVYARFGEINGPILIADDAGAAGNGVYKNVKIKVVIDSYGSNIQTDAGLFRCGAYGADNFMTTEMTNMTTDNITLDITVPPLPALTLPLHIYSPSPNHGLWNISEVTPYEMFGLTPKNAAGVYGAPILHREGRIFKTVFGDLTAPNAKVLIPSSYLISRENNSDFQLVLRVLARNGVGSTNAKHMSEYYIIGYVDASGNIFINDRKILGNLESGTPASVFTISTTADFKNLQVTATGYTNVSGSLIVSYTFP